MPVSGRRYLTVIDRKIQVVQRVVGRTVDDVFKRVTSHIRIMILQVNTKIGVKCAGRGFNIRIWPKD